VERATQFTGVGDARSVITSEQSSDNGASRVSTSTDVLALVVMLLARQALNDVLMCNTVAMRIWGHPPLTAKVHVRRYARDVGEGAGLEEAGFGENRRRPRGQEDKAPSQLTVTGCLAVTDGYRRLQGEFGYPDGCQLQLEC
jgi:hypothetical protein